MKKKEKIIKMIDVEAFPEEFLKKEEKTKIVKVEAFPEESLKKEAKEEWLE